jgi:hypothetical protein
MRRRSPGPEKLIEECGAILSSRTVGTPVPP